MSDCKVNAFVESEDEEDGDYAEIENKKIKMSYTHATRQLNPKKISKPDFEDDGFSDQVQDDDANEKEENDFERQLRLEKEEAERKASEKKLTRTDPDGTEYEYDPVIKGWFPKVCIIKDFDMHVPLSSRLGPCKKCCSSFDAI
jgi:hypothetical protein